MKSQLIPADIDHIIGLIEQIADAVMKSDFLTKDEQRQLNDHLKYEKLSRGIEAEERLGMLGPTRWNVIKAYERNRDRIQTPYEADKANLLKSKRDNLRNKHVKVTVPPLQRELDLYLAPRWVGLLQCSSWGFKGSELRKALEYYFLGIPGGYRLFPPETTLPSKKLKVIRELERIRAKLEYDMQRLMSSKVEAGPCRNAGESSSKPAETGQGNKGQAKMDTQTINTPENLEQAIVKFVESNHSHEDVKKTYDDARKCIIRFYGYYPSLPTLPAWRENPLDGLQDILLWYTEANKAVDDIVFNLERQTIDKIISRFKKLKGFAKKILASVNNKLKEQAQKEARAKVEKEYKKLDEEASKTKGMLLSQQEEVVMKLEQEAQAILRRETEDAVQIYLSKDLTFKNRISQQDNEISKVFEEINKLASNNTPDGELIDIYCKLKDIPLQQQFTEVGLSFADLAGIIFGNCNRLYTSVDNVIKTFENIQTKIETKRKGSSSKPAGTEQENKGSKTTSMLDSKILAFAKRLIQVEIKEREKPFFDEYNQKARELQKSTGGPHATSAGTKLLLNIITEELKNRASVAWESLQRAHEALGSQLTGTLASDFKETANHFLAEITKELSEFMTQRPGFAENGTANSILHSAKNDACEKLDIEIDLYVSNSVQHPPVGGNKSEQSESKKTDDKPILIQIGNGKQLPVSSIESAPEPVIKKAIEAGYKFHFPSKPFQAGYICQLVTKDDYANRIAKLGFCAISDEESILIRSACGGKYDIAKLRLFLAQKCNISSPDNMKMKEIITVLNEKCEITEEPPAKTGQGNKTDKEPKGNGETLPPIDTERLWDCSSLNKLREIDSNAKRDGISGDKTVLKRLKEYLTRSRKRKDVAETLYYKNERIKTTMPHRSMFKQK